MSALPTPLRPGAAPGAASTASPSLLVTLGWAVKAEAPRAALSAAALPAGDADRGGTGSQSLRAG